MSMSKFMRMIVFFDLPVKNKTAQKAATRFRNFLLRDGYYMVQYSIYARICMGHDGVATHKTRLYNNLPENGSIRLLVITEKQYEGIEMLLGSHKPEDSPAKYEQLRIY